MEGTKDRNMKLAKTKYPFLILLFALLQLIAGAQNINDYRARVYNSYAGGDMSDWKVVLTEMEKEYEKTGDRLLLEELFTAQYGYIGFCLKEERKKEASKYLDKARSGLEILKSENPENAKYLALEGALLGYEMGIHKIKAMVLGPKAKEKIDAAVEKDPRHIRTMLEKANQLNFSPKIVGGNKEEAVEYYNKVIDTMEADPASLQYNWIYINTLIVLAQVHEKMGNNTYACAIYEKIMDYDPGIKWVRTDLYSGCRDNSSSVR